MISVTFYNEADDEAVLGQYLELEHPVAIGDIVAALPGLQGVWRVTNRQWILTRSEPNAHLDVLVVPAEGIFKA